MHGSWRGLQDLRSIQGQWGYSCGYMVQHILLVQLLALLEHSPSTNAVCRGVRMSLGDLD